MTNGFDTYVWDDLAAPQRRASRIFAKSDLEKLLSRRTQQKSWRTVVIQDGIADAAIKKKPFALSAAISGWTQKVAVGHGHQAPAKPERPLVSL